MTTAPNSLMPRANIIINPETTERHACGSDIVKKIRDGEAPSISAARPASIIFILVALVFFVLFRVLATERRQIFRREDDATD